MNNSSTAKPTRGHTTNANCLVNIFLQVRIQQVLQKPRIAVIVFRYDEHKRIRAHHHSRKSCVFQHLPGIVGAFLAGLSVNAAVQTHPAKEKLEFLGKALFIPSFFIVTGFLIAPGPFVRSLSTISPWPSESLPPSS